MENLERLHLLEEALYKLCSALVSICDRECCNYGFDDEVEMAEEYIKGYEKDHPNDTVLKCRDCKYAAFHCTEYETDVDALDGCSNWESGD